jgi:hypothetical protein
VSDPIELDRVLQRLDNRLLADHILEDLRPEFSGDDLVIHEW